MRLLTDQLPACRRRRKGTDASLFNRLRTLLRAGFGLLLRAAALFRKLALRLFADGLFRGRAFALFCQPLLLGLLLGLLFPLAGQALPLGVPLVFLPGLLLR